MKNPVLEYCHRAYTLMELLIAVAIITILTTLSLPVLYPPEQYEAGQVFSQTGAMIANAKAIAIRRHSVVVICPSLAGEACDGNWTAGMLMFVDGNLNRLRDSSESVIEHQVWGRDLSNAGGQLSGSLQWRVFGNRQSIRISALGEMDDQNGSLTWCPPPGSAVPAHQMVINSSGRIRLAMDIDGDGVREDSQGRPLVCQNL